MAAKKAVLSDARAISPTKSLLLHTTKHLALSTIILLLITGCAAIPTPTRIALLAPFEGRYREVGYEALYAARLAMQDTDSNFIELLPVEDGGSPDHAVLRAEALHADPDVAAVMVLGYAATAPVTLAAFGDLPVLVIGDWGVQSVSGRTFVLSNAKINDRLSIPARTEITEAALLPAPLTGGHILALTQFAQLRLSLDGITILSSAALPDAAFVERYAASDQFAREPRLLASLTYDAARIAASAAQNAQNGRDEIYQILSAMDYAGLNGVIRFKDGYWADAPIHEYVYDESGDLLPVNDLVK